MRLPARALVVAFGALLAVAAPPALASASRAEVLVELRPPSVADSTPLSALRDAKGHVDLARPAPRRALASLARDQRAAAQRLQKAAPGLQVRAHLRTVMDALVVTVPRDELTRLAGVRGVRRVWPAVRYRQETTETVVHTKQDVTGTSDQTDRVPTVVGATPLWAGVNGGTPVSGDGERVAIIDDGIDITRPSFSGTGYKDPPGFPKGFRSDTNGKVIVARVFPPPDGAPRTRTPFDPNGSEHGTHVAGIAAGISGITAHTSVGVTVTNLSGVAPHAYLGSYRVLTTPTPSFGLDGNGPEIAQAIDRAVADGMDVLNLSLGEPEVQESNDLVARAIHGAARAGVVTVVAAGNSGQDLGDGSISSPGSAPDAITVAATSVGRFFGVDMAVLGPGAPPADLAAFGAATDTPDEIPAAWSAGIPLVVATDCGGGRAGALLLVQLGPHCTPARADSGIAPGSLGIVYAQRVPGDPTAVDDSLQRSLTVSDLIGARLAAQAAAAGGELSLSIGNKMLEQVSANAGLIAGFSSRGPDPYSLGLKPDVSAPGVDIISPIPGGYGIWSGTSMATPAVSGAVALLRERHPDWTPAQIKSALVLTGRPVYNDTAHQHPTSILGQGGGLIDVQAADSPGVFAAPSEVDFGLLESGHSVVRSIKISDAGGGAGAWTVSAPGLATPAALDVPAGGSQTLSFSLQAPAGASVGNRSGNIVLTSAGHTVHIRWWGYVEHPKLASVKARALPAGRWVSGSTVHGTKLVSHYRWPASPGGSGLPRAYPGREQLWSFTVPPGARNAGVEAQGPVVPLILLARDENRLAGETALPENSNPYLEGYGRFERVSGLLVPAPGRYYVVVETRPGHAPAPYKLRLWVNDRTPPVISAISRHLPRSSRVLTFHLSDSGSGVSVPDLVVTVDGTQEETSVSAGGEVRVDIGSLSVGKHRLVISASDIQETKNSENASALALPNTRVLDTAFTVDATG